MAIRFHRYVAIGDSSTEGMIDPDGQGGFRGWANRLAEHIAATQGSLLYANLGVRGRRTREIREEQLAPALAMQPDLVTLFCGTNDVVQRHFDPVDVRKDFEAMQGALVASGATVIGFTLPDLTPVMPLGRLIRHKVERLNEEIRAASAATGAICVDTYGRLRQPSAALSFDVAFLGADAVFGEYDAFLETQAGRSELLRSDTFSLRPSSMNLLFSAEADRYSDTYTASWWCVLKCTAPG